MRILFVAMSQSIHTVRWIQQFRGQGWDMHLFPSLGCDIHPGHRDVTIHARSFFLGKWLDPSIRTKNIVWPFPHNWFVGQAERWMPRLIDGSRRLAKLIETLKPDVVHSLEMQHGGYQTLAARELLKGAFPPWIVMNWGNDTYYFGKIPTHEAQLRKVFAACNYYDCECERDVEAARDFGFRGKVLRVSPNAGGFDLNAIEQWRAPGPTSKRQLIVLKGYQGWAGRAIHALKAIELVAESLRDYTIAIYVASGEVRAAAQRLAERTGLKIQFVPRVSHEEMMRLHGQARMSIGISVTDGVSISFLEALAMGSFPIQTHTACCQEWVRDGESGFVVAPEDIDGIANAIRQAATNDALVDRAEQLNRITTRERLNGERLRQVAVNMYERAVAEGVD